MKDFSKAKGSSTLKMVANKLSNEVMPVLLEMASLLEHPDNEYLFGMEGIEHLAQGIRQNGFRGAIEVWDMGNGKYMIYSGTRRNRAMALNGETKIRSFVYPYPEEESVRRRLLLGANLYGRNSVDNSQPIYTARQMEYHKETLKMEKFKGDIRAEIAKEFGVSSSQVHKYMSILNLTPELQEQVNKDILPMTVASEVGAMAEEKQELAYKSFNAYLEAKESDKVKRDDGLAIVKTIKTISEPSEVKAEDIISSVDQKEPTTEECNDVIYQEQEPVEPDEKEIKEDKQPDNKEKPAESNNAIKENPVINVKELALEILQKNRSQRDEIAGLIENTSYEKRKPAELKLLETCKLKVKAFELLLEEISPTMKNTSGAVQRPELPKFKNNDMRKAFIESYETWGIWKESIETEERYYRYDFDNGGSIVVKVYFQKGYSWSMLNKKDHWGSTEYYLIKNPGDHFIDCKSNMTSIVDYLKDMQK